MSELNAAWEAIKFGGYMVYPLLLLGVIALIIIFDRAVMYSRCLRMPAETAELVETFGFSWDTLARQVDALGVRNAYARFIRVILANRNKPAWWVESRAGDEAGEIEKSLNRGLWVLETVVTAAPLMGLLGTITGMMEAFEIIGGAGLVAPAKVTSGVAQALISTALGLLIALLALFAFNFFSKMQSRALDHMERFGSRLVDHIRLDREDGGGDDSDARESAEPSRRSPRVAEAGR
ncbi:MAG: MotA/TolQ/ExbB proton channel family protein [Candidatus Binataceae bacterium]